MRGKSPCHTWINVPQFLGKKQMPSSWLWTNLLAWFSTLFDDRTTEWRSCPPLCPSWYHDTPSPLKLGGGTFDKHPDEIHKVQSFNRVAAERAVLFKHHPNTKNRILAIKTEWIVTTIPPYVHCLDHGTVYVTYEWHPMSYRLCTVHRHRLKHGFMIAAIRDKNTSWITTPGQSVIISLPWKLLSLYFL